MSAMLSLFLLYGTAWAADPAPSEPIVPGSANDPAVVPPAEDASLIPGIPPGPPPPADQVQNIAYRIGLSLRCPVCQGSTVADSTSPTAVQMLLRIRELVRAGYDEEQIRQFFIQRYGEWIVLEPDTKGFNLLIWIGPGLLVGLGVAWSASVMMKWRKEPDEVPLPSDVGLIPKDRYEQRLLAELED